MPQCRKCAAKFANYAKIDGKTHNLKNRKYCLVCSPFGKHNTSQIEKPKIVDCVCLLCKRTYSYQRGNGHTKTKCNSCKTNARRLESKKRAITYKGGKCQACSYNRCFDALSFHHLDPKKKDFKISSNHCRSWKIIKKELDKCVLLCVRCHAEVHANMLDVNNLGV